MSVVMLSLPCGWVCTLVGLPPMFGYIVCGVLLGPSGLNSIKVGLCTNFLPVNNYIFNTNSGPNVLCVLIVHASNCVFQSMVQVETLGELGVFFTLFVVGLEFSPERLRKVNTYDLHFCPWMLMSFVLVRVGRIYRR